MTCHEYKNHHSFIRDFSDPNLKEFKSKIRHCNENKGSEKQQNQLAESGIEKEEGCAVACIVTAQMKGNQGFPMSNNGSTSKPQPRPAPQYQQHRYQSMVHGFLLMGNKRKLGRAQINKARYRTNAPD